MKKAKVSRGTVPTMEFKKSLIFSEKPIYLRVDFNKLITDIKIDIVEAIVLCEKLANRGMTLGVIETEVDILLTVE